MPIWKPKDELTKQKMAAEQEEYRQRVIKLSQDFMKFLSEHEMTIGDFENVINYTKGLLNMEIISKIPIKYDKK